MTDDLLTTDDAAKLLGVSPRRVQEFARAGRLKPRLTVRGAYLFARDAVLAFRDRPRPSGRPRRQPRPAEAEGPSRADPRGGETP